MIRTLLLVVLVACAEPVVEMNEYPCPDDASNDAAITYETFGREFLDTHCNRCHNASPGHRHGAPESYRFETLADVQRHRERIFARSATTNTSMPPGPDDPDPEEREDLATWLACGAR